MLLLLSVLFLFLQPAQPACQTTLTISIVDGTRPAAGLTVQIGAMQQQTDTDGHTTFCLASTQPVLVQISGQIGMRRITLEDFDQEQGGIRFFPQYGTTMHLGVDTDNTITVLPDDWARDDTQATPVVASLSDPTTAPPTPTGRGWGNVLAVLMAVLIGIAIYVVQGRDTEAKERA